MGGMPRPPPGWLDMNVVTVAIGAAGAAGVAMGLWLGSRSAQSDHYAPVSVRATQSTMRPEMETGDAVEAERMVVEVVAPPQSGTLTPTAAQLHVRSSHHARVAVRRKLA
jgi:hypothetical protein